MLRKRNRNRAANGVLAIWMALVPSAGHAQTFCDQLRRIVDAAPDFESLRGTQLGSAYVATITIAGAPHCLISNQTGSDNKPISSKWEYDCVWQNRFPESVPWFKSRVQSCYPDAAYKDFAGSKDRSGGAFVLSNAVIGILFDPKTGQLNLNVENPYFRK